MSSSPTPKWLRVACCSFALATLLAPPIVAQGEPSTDTLIVSRFLGGSDFDELRGIAVDSQGNTIVTGHTSSQDLPVRDAFQSTFGGGEFDVYVAKLDPDGEVIWLTYLGGNSRELAYDVSVGPDDSIYVAGGTASANFPVQGGPFLTYSGGLDSFVTRFAPDGTLLNSGYIGGTDFDSIRGNAVDRDGAHYVFGRTLSTDGSFPVAVGPMLTHQGIGDAFVAKVAADGQLEYCGFVGGADIDYGRNVVVDEEGYAYVVGWTNSDETSFPVAVGPQLTYSGGEDFFSGSTVAQYGDGFIAKIDRDGSQILACGYIGGVNADATFGVGLLPDGSIALAGHTISDPASLGVLRGPDLEFNGVNSYIAYGDAWVGQLKADFSGFEFLGYVGGDQADRAWKLNVGPRGMIYLAGITASDPRTFPDHRSGARTHWGKESDAYVAVVDPRQAKVIHSSVFGGASDELFRDIVIADNGNIHAVGWTESSDFPTKRSLQPNLEGVRDGAVVIMQPSWTQVRSGNTLGDGEDFPRPMLRVNGSTGEGAERIVKVRDASPVDVSLDAIGLPGQSNPTSNHILFAWLGPLPEDGMLCLEPNDIGFRLGTSLFPVPTSPLDQRDPRLITLGNTFGGESWLGYPVLPIGPAPFHQLVTPFGSEMHLQAVVQNPNAIIGWSLSNIVTIRIQP